MNFFIVYAHPERRSFNAALHSVVLDTLTAQGHQIVVSDLYQMDFEPVASSKDFITQHPNDQPRFREEQRKAFQRGALARDISIEQEKLKWCDLLILQFPLWWFSMPAILKGWVDRVMTPGFAYSRTMLYNHGGLRGRKAMVLLTTGGSQKMFSHKGLNGPIEAILFPIHHGILYYVGFQVLPPFITWEPSKLSDDRRSSVLGDLSAYLNNIESLEPIHFPKIEDCDADFQLHSEYDWTSILTLNQDSED